MDIEGGKHDQKQTIGCSDFTLLTVGGAGTTVVNEKVDVVVVLLVEETVSELPLVSCKTVQQNHKCSSNSNMFCTEVGSPRQLKHTGD